MLNSIFFSESKYIIKYLFIICSILNCFSLIVARNTPALGYESSIYCATPFIFWVILFLNMSLVISILVYFCMVRDFKRSRLWMIGVFLLLFTNITILSLYIIRGYYMWNISGDSSTHLMYIKQIIENGIIPKSLVYPIMHVYTVEISQITCLDIIFLHKIVPLMFAILYVVYMYLFLKLISTSRSQIIFTIILITALSSSFYLNFTPINLSNLFFPLILFLFYKSMLVNINIVQWKILALIMVFLFPLFHPIPAFAFSIFILGTFLSQKIIDHLHNNQMNIIYPLNINYTLWFILLIWSIHWISSFSIWEWSIVHSFSSLLQQESAAIDSLQSKVTYAQGYGFNVGEHIFKKIGVTLYYILLSVVSFPLALKKLYCGKKEGFVLLSFYISLTLFLGLILIFYLVNLPFGPLRMLMYVDVICIIICGFFLSHLNDKIHFFSKKKLSHILTITIVVMLILIHAHGFMKLYPSPYTLETSYQTTKYEVEGMDWFFQNRNMSIMLSTVADQQEYRFADLLLTSEDRIKLNTPWIRPDKLKVPYHFDYKNNNSLSSYYGTNVYLLITDRERSIYEDIFPTLADIRWVINDYKELENDSTVEKVYSNKELNVYYVIT